MIPQILEAILPVFLTVIIGAAFHRFGWMEPAFETGLMRLNLNLFFPCFILGKVIGDPLLSDVGTVGWALATGYASVTAGLVMSALAARLLLFKQGQGQRTFTVVTAIQNYGFMALPVLVALFGEGPLGVLFLHGMGVELAMWTLGVMVLRGLSGAGWRSIVNGPCLAVILGLALHYGGGARWLPGPLLGTLRSLGTCAVPTALFAIGAVIASQARMEPWKFQIRTVLGASVLRLAAIPLVMLLMAHHLPVPVAIKQVLLVQAAMPAAVFPIVLARMYGGHPATAIQVVVVTTMASLGTMPWILKWGARWLGL
ncbi:MAG: AEC family transporter [Verrucomicrobia bacterium]|nr:AEC family transporter [Verrucomicrobiota bacterium]